MHDSDTNIPEIICGFHSRRVRIHSDFTKLEISRFDIKDFKSCKCLGRKVHFSALREQLKFRVFSDSLFKFMLHLSKTFQNCLKYIIFHSKNLKSYEVL